MSPENMRASKYLHLWPFFQDFAYDSSDVLGAVSFLEAITFWVGGGGVGGVVEGEPRFVVPLSVVVKFGEPAVVFEFPGIADLGGSVVVRVLPFGWLFVVVVGAVWFVGGVGVVVDGVEFRVDVGDSFVG